MANLKSNTIMQRNCGTESDLDVFSLATILATNLEFNFENGQTLVTKKSVLEENSAKTSSQYLFVLNFISLAS